MVNVFLKIKKIIIGNKYFVFLSILYFIFRLINLTKLPIFNDEAIYLDWGFRETHRAGFLYYSLYDAKQPFLMWIFGIAESLISDPLFAGRFVSVAAGFLTFTGIYKLAQSLFEKKVALISAFIYIIIPIFSFYDRQALMESSIATVGIWAGFFLVKYLKENSLKFSILAGIILGVGFFIKSSTLVFALSYVLVVLGYSVIFKRVKIINDLLMTGGVFLISISLLLINPQFWSTFGSNSRYSLTIDELLSFPFSHWFASLFTNAQIAFFYVTPLLFLASLIGMIFIFVSKSAFKKIAIVFFILSVLTATLLVRVPTERYLISFLPFMVIPVAYIIVSIFRKNKFSGAFIMFILFSIPFGLTLLQIVNPVSYFLLVERYASVSDMGYLRGFTSGYGVDETISYFQNLSKSHRIIITVGENSGNPESAMFDYFYRNPNVQVVYFDSRLFGSSLATLDCLSTTAPLYFVAREEQLVGLDKYLQKIKTIKNPYGTNTIGIYTLKKNCKGKTLKLQITAT